SATARSSSSASTRLSASAPARPMRRRSEPAPHRSPNMTLKKLTRAGLVALAVSALAGVFFAAAPIIDHSSAYAQAPAAAPAAPAAPAAAATDPARPPAWAANADPKKAVLEKCSPNSGDTAWMLTSVALVLMMTIPGLGLFYGGMVRKKNVGDTVMTSFAITCLITI